MPITELPERLVRLGRALKPDGVLYATFTDGAGERERGWRRFTDLDEMALEALAGAVPALALLKTWVTGDRREGREGARWFNAAVAADGDQVPFSKGPVQPDCLRSSWRSSRPCSAA